MPDPVQRLVGRRVLLVEDEYLIAVEMERCLREAGIEVVGPVPSVEQALDLIEDENAPDAAVLDVNLGNGETVYSVADRLNALGVPFLFATGDMRIGGGPVHHQKRPQLEKPIATAQLLQSLAALLKQS